MFSARRLTTRSSEQRLAAGSFSLSRLAWPAAVAELGLVRRRHPTTMKTSIAFLCCLLFAITCRCQTLAERTEPQPDESQRPPVGVLGYPLGSYLTIEGVRVESGQGRRATESLIVDTVSGHKLAKPVTIHISTMLPSGRCIFKGYEEGSWAGDWPPEVDHFQSRGGLHLSESWHFRNVFTITLVVAPADFQPYSPRL